MGTKNIARGRVWMMGLGIGLKSLRTEPVLGLKRLVLPVNYWRTTEFAYVFQRLGACSPASRILDLGSPKDLAAMLARHKGHAVVATDILPQAIALSRRYAEAQGLDGLGPGRVESEVKDGRALSYPENSFDAAYSVSVLEHIPERGDSAALRELIRVVKPGGDVVVTVPYAPSYDETYVNHSVYERQQVGSEAVFYERHYDDLALRERLLTSAPVDLIDLQLWGEGTARVEALLSRLGTMSALFSPFEPLLSIAFLRPVRPGQRVYPMAAFITVRKRR
jgi:SAM-dependent methyltransferase